MGTFWCCAVLRQTRRTGSGARRPGCRTTRNACSFWTNRQVTCRFSSLASTWSTHRYELIITGDLIHSICRRRRRLNGHFHVLEKSRFSKKFFSGFFRFLGFYSKTEHESTTQKLTKNIPYTVYTVRRILLKTNLQWAKEKNTMWKTKTILMNLTNHS